MDARLANTGAAPATTKPEYRTDVVAKYESLLRQSRLIEGTARAVSFGYSVTLGKALLGDREALSASLHNDDWLKTYVAANTSPDGDLKPRPKPTAYRPDGAGGWTHDPAAKHIVDIAQSFDKLPPDWQVEDFAAAMAVRDIMRGKPATIEDAASQVHDRWLARPNNAYAKGGPTDVPYAQLPVEEKLKDLVHVLTWAKQTEPERVPEIERHMAALRAGG